jgi:protein-L-isoaspartate(D-aspartate) O-methyltransferase
VHLLSLVTALLIVLASCGGASQEPYAMQRSSMVREQIEARGVRDVRVLDALRRVPRERFVLPEAVGSAYADNPLPIGSGQTISQPYIVAVMTEAAAIAADSVVLEIGTGSGYQTAILGELAREVYSIEVIPALATRAASVLRELAYDNVHLKVGDGYAGWPEHAPFDAIVVTAAPPTLPEALRQQLKIGGRLVVPVGTDDQHLMLIRRTPDGFTKQRLMGVRFVPMVPGR